MNEDADAERKIKGPVRKTVTKQKIKGKQQIIKGQKNRENRNLKHTHGCGCSFK